MQIFLQHTFEDILKRIPRVRRVIKKPEVQPLDAAVNTLLDPLVVSKGLTVWNSSENMSISFQIFGLRKITGRGETEHFSSSD